MFQSNESPVGFIGLGNMGNHMARNLLKKGYPVVAFDISKDSLRSLENDGMFNHGYRNFRLT